MSNETVDFILGTMVGFLIGWVAVALLMNLNIRKPW